MQCKDDSYIFRVLLHGSISFSVDTTNDAHIVLTTKDKESEPMVEIFLGGWKNTASAIRYNKQSPDKVKISFFEFMFLFTHRCYSCLTFLLTHNGHTNHFIVFW